MRVNLITQSSDSSRFGGAIPLSLTICPACGLPGDYQYYTDSTELIEMLAKQTDLPSAVLDRFEKGFRAPTGAKLLGVELSERCLTDLGYFIA
jgi:hypothetical protein